MTSRALVALLALAACKAPEADPNIADPLGRCSYINAFSDRAECKEYLGSNWTPEAIQADCEAPVPGSDPGLYEPDLGCDKSEILGQCFVDAGTVEAATIVFPGVEGDSCSGLQMGCGFAGGEYVPAEPCGGAPVEDPGSSDPFKPFERVCREPLPGEPPGQTDGQVCTWQAISGSTEEGRHFEDYASCAPVVKQRPYWAAEVEAVDDPNDPRHDDAAWQGEFAWMTAQVEASGCVCCHTERLAPDGPSGWYLEAPGFWIDTVDDDGLAMLAGWIDSTAFGAFPPDENNGFDRTQTGVSTTDPARMKAFLEGELARRGLEPADFADAPAFGGPLADQLAYEPDACSGSAGVDGDGRITWAGGGARYVYILEEGAANPGVPPNLDLPTGTIWRLDVPWFEDPIRSGITYGSSPQGTVQAYPDGAAAPPLQPGETYYLYVLRDIYQPLTRCLFTAR